MEYGKKDKSLKNIVLQLIGECKKPFLSRVLFSYKTQILLLLFFTISFLFRSDFSFDQDLGMHIKLGQIIWQTKNVPKINLVSYTNTNFPFINHHWLFEVLVYLGSISVGFEVLMVIKIAILLLCVWQILRLSGRTKSALFFSVSFLVLHLLRERTDLRPEIFSFLFTVIIVSILELYDKKNTKFIYFLPVILLLWTNTHIYFPVGIFLELIFLADLLYKKYVYKQQGNTKVITLSVITVLSILCTFINPNFISGALYPFTVFNNYGVTITENQTILTLQNIHFVDPDFLFLYLAAFLVIGSIYASFWRTKFSVKNILLAFLGLGLAFQSIRGFPYIVFISLPYILMNFNYKTETIWSKSVTLLFMVLLIGESVFYLSGQYYGLTYAPNTPSLTMIQDEKPAADFLLAHDLPQPLFNNFDTGSYLVYRAYPEYKVFIDERPEAFPATFFTNIYNPMQENYQVFKKYEKIYGFKTIFFTISDQNPRAINFLNAITTDPEWKTVFLDQYMIILVKSSLLKQFGLSAINLTRVNTTHFLYASPVAYTSLATFFINIQQVKEAILFDQNALRLNPDNPAANKVMAYILYLQNPNDPRITNYATKMINKIFW